MGLHRDFSFILGISNFKRLSLHNGQKPLSAEMLLILQHYFRGLNDLYSANQRHFYTKLFLTLSINAVEPSRCFKTKALCFLILSTVQMLFLVYCALSPPKVPKKCIAIKCIPISLHTSMPKSVFQLNLLSNSSRNCQNRFASRFLVHFGNF